jgi:molybdate transport system substrate-binding protein
MRSVIFSLRSAIACLLAVVVAHAAAADILVLSTPTLKTALEDLRPGFERSTGHRLVMQFDSVAALKRRIEAGEAFDLALLLPTAIDDLAKQRLVRPESKTSIARAGVGVAVQAGAAHGAVESVEGLRDLLLLSKSFAYAADSASGAYFLKVLDALEIPQARSRLRPVPGGAVVEAIARGEADVTIITVPNILGVAGVELAGLLPASLQSYTTFVGAVAAPLDDGAPAYALLRFLKTDAARDALARRGFERTT